MENILPISQEKVLKYFHMLGRDKKKLKEFLDKLRNKKQESQNK